MRKFVFIILGLAVLAAAVFFVATRTETGQNALMKQAMSAGFKARPELPDGLRVVVCGSASPLGNDPSRAQACIAVVTKEHFLLFDLGARSPQRITQAGLPAGRLNGVFLTHFHSDHIAGLPDVNLASWVRGRRQSLPVYGPTGIEQVIAGFNMAYALDRGYRTEHHGEQTLPASAGPMTPVTLTAGEVAWENNGMTVRSFLVAHDPVKPALGYRVDYKGRSVVISGDTNATDSLFTAAKDADLVLHDALSRALIDPMIEAATNAGAPVMPKIMNDVLDYHADSLTLEDHAKAAGVKQLALYHLVPIPPNAIAESIFRRGLSDDTLLVKDLHTFDMPPESDVITITAP